MNKNENMDSVPERERLVWENAEIRESLEKGLAESAAGDVVSLGSFSAYL